MPSPKHPAPKKPATPAKKKPVAPPVKPPQKSPPPSAKPQPAKSTNNVWYGPPRSRQEPLWMGQRIPIIGLCGRPASGKTIFAMDICPEDTCMIDPEMSGVTYYEDQNVRHYVNVPEEVAKATGRFTAINYVLWLQKFIAGLPRYNSKGKEGFRVIGLENLTMLEEGIEALVRKSPDKFGLKGRQSEGGLMWGKVKEVERSILLDLASKCETFVYTLHMGKAYVAGQVTNRDKPKGKEPTLDLASLYLHLSRTALKSGKVPDKPIAVNAYKMRLKFSKRDPNTGEMTHLPMLPPTIFDCTPAKIRAYIARGGIDYAKLSPEERQIDLDNLTDDEKLELQASISANNAKVAELSLEATRLESEMAERREAIRGTIKDEEMAEITEEEEPEETTAAEAETEEEEAAAPEGETYEEESQDETVATEEEEAKEGDEDSGGEAEETEGEDDGSVVDFPPRSLGEKGDKGSIRILQALKRHMMDDDPDFTEDDFLAILKRRNVTRIEDLREDLAEKLIAALQDTYGIDADEMDNLLRKYFPKHYQ